MKGPTLHEADVLHEHFEIGDESSNSARCILDQHSRGHSYSMRSKRYDTHFELGALLVLNLRPEKLIATVWSVRRYFSGRSVSTDRLRLCVRIWQMERLNEVSTHTLTPDSVTAKLQLDDQ